MSHLKARNAVRSEKKASLRYSPNRRELQTLTHRHAATHGVRSMEVFTTKDTSNNRNRDAEVVATIECI